MRDKYNLNTLPASLANLDECEYGKLRQFDINISLLSARVARSPPFSVITLNILISEYIRLDLRASYVQMYGTVLKPSGYMETY